MIYKIKKALKIAEHTARLSPDADTKVGAVLVDGGDLRAIADSFNGFLRDHSGEGLSCQRPEKYKHILHAERSLLFECARLGVATENHMIACTLSPCPDCLRAMWQSGIKTVFFTNRYRDIDSSFQMKDLKVTETQLSDRVFQWDLSV